MPPVPPSSCAYDGVWTLYVETKELKELYQLCQSLTVVNMPTVLCHTYNQASIKALNFIVS